MPRLAGFLLGFGLGGLTDGIILHQILQWHHLVSARTPDVAANTFADGLFGASMLLVVVTGVWRLWWEARDAGLRVVAAALIGWGTFHLVDSVLFHAILGLHHIWPNGPGGEALWDGVFLALGVVLMGLGLALGRSVRARRS